MRPTPSRSRKRASVIRPAALALGDERLARALVRRRGDRVAVADADEPPLLLEVAGERGVLDLHAARARAAPRARRPPRRARRARRSRPGGRASRRAARGRAAARSPRPTARTAAARRGRAGRPRRAAARAPPRSSSSHAREKTQPPARSTPASSPRCAQRLRTAPARARSRRSRRARRAPSARRSRGAAAPGRCTRAAADRRSGAQHDAVAARGDDGLREPELRIALADAHDAGEHVRGAVMDVHARPGSRRAPRARRRGGSSTGYAPGATSASPRRSSRALDARQRDRDALARLRALDRRDRAPARCARGRAAAPARRAARRLRRSSPTRACRWRRCRCRAA